MLSPVRYILDSKHPREFHVVVDKKLPLWTFLTTSLKLKLNLYIDI